MFVLQEECLRLIRLSRVADWKVLNVLLGRSSTLTNSEDSTMNWLLRQTDKFVESFKDNYLEVCVARSVWMIACRKLDGTDSRQEPGDTCWSKTQGS